MVYIIPQIEAFHIHTCTHTLYCGAVHTNRTSGDNIRKGRYATPFVAIIQSNYTVHAIRRSSSLQDEKRKTVENIIIESDPQWNLTCVYNAARDEIFIRSILSCYSL